MSSTWTTVQTVLWIVFIAVLIFWPAGTLAYAGGWAFFALFGIGGAATFYWLYKYSPQLARERLGSPVQRGQGLWDRIFLLLFMIGFVVWLALMSWDARRTDFTAIPVELRVAGGAALILYMIGVWLTFRENAFAAPVVKIQEGQRVIDTGPYALVRHPMYGSAVLLFLGVPLVLGSWLGVAAAPLFILGLAWRAVHEEETLRTGLAGYDAYMQRVRYRFVPWVW